MKMRLNKGGFVLIPEGTYVFRIDNVDMSDYAKFGKVAVEMSTVSGLKHTERFSLLTSNGEVNEGAMNAFSYFAHTALNDYNVEDFDTEDLVGRFIRAEVIHKKSDKINEKTGKPYVNANLGDKEPAIGFDDDSGDSDDLDDLEEL